MGIDFARGILRHWPGDKPSFVVYDGGLLRKGFVMAGLAFEREMEFAHGTADQVSPLIRRIVCNNPGPFTFTGTGTYIVGQDSVAVIDPGPLNEDHYAALMAELDGKTVSHIIITHTHMDHSPLAARLTCWAWS